MPFFQTLTDNQMNPLNEIFSSPPQPSSHSFNHLSSNYLGIRKKRKKKEKLKKTMKYYNASRPQGGNMP